MNPTSGPVRYNGPVPARSIGRYQVVRVLGTGGFATVYLARDDRLDADVAVKVLAENWCHDPEISHRFLEEARLLRRCDDDRIVRVHTIEQLEDGRPYFVMDYADGGTLADRMLAALDDGRPFGLREAVVLACDVADCLSVVHDCGIVHRDLKPSNVLFRTVRAQERMVLGDFGLARQLVTATGRTILAGTPEYVAPEQADPILAGTVDERADVYAAAVILHELLAGAVPFGYSSLDQAAAPTQGPPDLRRVRPDVPPDLAAVVARGMDPDRDARFPTGRAWMLALRDVLATLSDDAPLAVRPPVPVAGVPVAAVPVAGEALAAPQTGPAAANAAARPVPPGPGPTPPPPQGVDGAPPPPPPPGPAAPAAAPGRRSKPLWPLFAGVLGAFAVVAAIAVVLGRGGGAGPSSAAGPSAPPAAGSATTSSAPTVSTATANPPATSAAPGTVPAARTGPAAWFAAASGPTCRPAVGTEQLPGVVAAVTCTYPGVVAVFGQTASPAEASAVLARDRRRRPGSAVTGWGDGEAVISNVNGELSIAWDYTGEPYVAVAVSGNRATLTSWWTSTGRTVRTG